MLSTTDSVVFAHSNTRAELRVKTAKRLLRDNMSSTGKLDTLALTKALLTYRNTPAKGNLSEQLLWR